MLPKPKDLGNGWFDLVVNIKVALCSNMPWDALHRYNVWTFLSKFLGIRSIKYKDAFFTYRNTF